MHFMICKIAETLATIVFTYMLREDLEVALGNVDDGSESAAANIIGGGGTMNMEYKCNTNEDMFHRRHLFIHN